MLTHKVLVLPLALVGVLSAVAVDSYAQKIDYYTYPSVDVTLAFVKPGLVTEVKVREGDKVRQGDTVIQLDDRSERINLEWLKTQAEDVTRIKYADAQLAQRKVDLEKTQKAFAAAGATELEVQHAILSVTEAELQLELAKLNQRQDQRKYDEQKVRVEEMSLRSPIDGVVERLVIRQGEAADALAKVIRLVKIDPLWIDVPVPLAQARGLQIGQKAKVNLSQPDSRTVDGTIVFIGAVADPASSTLTVRLELPNATGRPAGERVSVILPNEAPAQQTSTRPSIPASELKLSTSDSGVPKY